MKEFNLILLIILVLYLIMDFQNKKEIHSTTKMKILGLVNMIFIISVIAILVYDYSSILNYLLLLIPLAIISAIYQYFRFIKSSEKRINKYIFLIINYIFIIVLFMII